MRISADVVVILGAALCTAAVGGCKDGSKDASGTSAASASKTGAADPARADEPDPCTSVETHTRGPLTWFHDDYATARSCAAQREVPLVVDLWAPWCHTCLSMKHHVLADPSLAPYADRFVWLAVDTDRERNAEVVGMFRPEVWPTFVVVSPEDDAVQARYLGAASVTQFRELLDHGEKAHRAASNLPADSPLRFLRDAERFAIAGEHAAAAKSYGDALAKAGDEWPRAPDVYVSLAASLYRAGAYADCLALGELAVDETGATASAADFAYWVATCASKQPKPKTRALRQKLAARVAALVDDADAPLSVDDRSDAMRILREIRTTLGDENGARAIAERQLAFLEEAAAEAPSPYHAMTYSWPRAEVHAYLGRAAALVEPLTKLVADLPNEYDPPYRLAWIYLQLDDHAKALDMAERALGLVYGPRKARVQSLVADVHAARGDTAAERAAREKVVAIYEALPEGQRREGDVERAKAALAAVGK